MSRPRFAALLGAVLATLLLTATPALAHTSLRSSSPANGATLDKPPASITLTFGEAVGLPAQPIRVTGPGGAAWTIGTATVKGATVTAPVTATGPAGAYTMSWRVIADDGDAVSGTVTFTLAGAAPAAAPAPVAVTAAATPTPVATSAPAPTSAAPVAAASSDQQGSGGVPVWVWIVGAVVVLGGGAAALIARSRRGSSE